jgi:hypothetical protein
VYFEMTKEGQSKFRGLTAALADRGAKTHRLESFAFEVSGRVYARPTVDYREFPRGLDAGSGLEFASLPWKTAKRVAAEIRGS